MARKKALGDNPLEKKKAKKSSVKKKKAFPIAIVVKAKEEKEKKPVIKPEKNIHSSRVFFKKPENKDLEVVMGDYLSSKENLAKKAEKDREEADKTKKDSLPIREKPVVKAEERKIPKNEIAKKDEEAAPGAMEDYLESKVAEDAGESKKAGIKPKKNKFKSEKQESETAIKTVVKKDKQKVVEDSDEIQTTTFFEGFSGVFQGVGNASKSVLGIGADAVNATGQFVGKGVLMGARVSGETVRLANRAAISTVDSLDHSVGPLSFKKKKINKQIESCEQREDELFYDLGKHCYKTGGKPEKIIAEKISLEIKKIHSQKNKLKKELSEM